MSFILQHRYCRECGGGLKGRKDQKFCNDYCRNRFNNRKNRIELAGQRKVNQILLKNKKIIAHMLLKEKKRKIRELDLFKKGFDFLYHTHLKKTKNGQTYIFCYEFGYIRLADEYLILVHWDNFKFK